MQRLILKYFVYFVGLILLSFVGFPVLVDKAAGTPETLPLSVIIWIVTNLAMVVFFVIEYRSLNRR